MDLLGDRHVQSAASSHSFAETLGVTPKAKSANSERSYGGDSKLGSREAPRQAVFANRSAHSLALCMLLLRACKLSYSVCSLIVTATL